MKITATQKTLAGFLAAIAVGAGGALFNLRDHFINAVLDLRADSAMETWLALYSLSSLVAKQVAASYWAALFAASLVVPLGALVRMVARARVRAGFRDPLDRMRQFTSRRGARWALTATPALWWLAISLRMVTHLHQPFELIAPVLALPLGAAFVINVLLTSHGLRALTAPTVVNEQTQAASAEGFSFDAVAVTTETIGAVGGLAALSAVMAVLAMRLPTSTLMHSPAFFAAVMGYVAIATGGSLLFRRASRISVGLDGIFVSGSARRRFVPFSEIDDARANGSSIELVRGTKIVLRLQLHSEDAIRRDALAARIRGAIKTATEHRNLPAVEFVRSAKEDAIARAAEGASTYRDAAPSRDKLWEVLESPAVDANGRKAAASALMRASDDGERTRLRVAAEQCAEPSVRARIYELLDEEEELPLPPRARSLRA